MQFSSVNRIPEQLLEQLKPAFQVDPLFIRTFVACLDLDPLLQVLTSGIVPVDIMSATLTHHIARANYILSENQRVGWRFKIIRILVHLGQQVVHISSVAKISTGQFYCPQFLPHFSIRMKSNIVLKQSKLNVLILLYEIYILKLVSV